MNAPSKMRRIPIMLTLVLLGAALASMTARATPTIVQLSSNDITPTAVRLYWSSGNGCTYTFQQAGSQDGPWTTLPITWPTASVAAGLTPGQTYWYRVLCTDSSGASAPSNLVAVSQPNAAQLTFGRPSSTTVSLSWTNDVTYNLAGLNFGAYYVFQNGTPLGSITNKNTRTYTVQGLTQDGAYSFYVRTDDTYSWGYSCPCVVAYSPTNEIHVAPLSSADFSSTTSGLTVGFAATAQDGVPPYTYAWNFGDGASGSGSTASHPYSAGGTYAVALTVTDSTGRTVTASHPVQVTAPGTPPTTNPSVPVMEEASVVAGSAAAIVAGLVVGILLIRRRRKTN